MRIFLLSTIIAFIFMDLDGRTYNFIRYTNDNGLSNNTIMACLQDRRGFVWFGTKEGLTRFDGFHFKIFLHSPLITNCLSNNFVTSLCEDPEGWIWIGTSRGICYYIPDEDYFGTIDSENPGIEELIYDVRADNKNYIWIAASSGTFRFNKATRQLGFYPSSEYFSPRNILLSNAGDIWITATSGKVFKYNEQTDNFISYQILSEKELSASVSLVNILDAGTYGLIIATNFKGLLQFDPNSGSITSLFTKDYKWNNNQIRTTNLFNNEEIWIGSESGIYIYNLKTGNILNLQMVPTDPYSLSNNAIRTITKDKEGGIWIGTFYGGVNYLPQQNKLFEKYYPTGLPGALNGNVVREMRADKYGNIWIGTEDVGLMKLDQKTGQFSSHTDTRGSSRIDSRNIQGLLVDENDLWVGTFDKGIYIFNIPGERVTNHFELMDGRSGLKTNSLITFLKTSDGTIYAGSSVGLYQYNLNTLSFRLMDEVAPGCFIHCLYEDSKRNIWIGTYGQGLYRYNRSSGSCVKIGSEKMDYKGLEDEHITSIYEDNHQNIWFTSEGNGFSYINMATGEIHRYVPGKDIDFAIYCAMLQDGNGYLWITSTRGLLRLDPSSDKFKTYTKNDGLLDNTFSYNSSYKDKKGKMYFGTVNGMISFYPSGINENTYNPPVYFTGFQVNGKEHIVNSTGSRDFKSVLVTNRILLKYDQTSLSIDFVSPSFTNPHLTRYKYMMTGSDPDWVLITGNRKVYYTNLSPGDYRFRVLSSPDGDTWSTSEAQLDIRIAPPVWFSIPAYVLYLIILVCLGYILIRSYLKQNALEQQRKIDFIEANKVKEILNAKINFFTNITHEVRTPLTLIKGPMDRILKSGIKTSKDTEDNLLIIKRNTDRLLSLTNQLLDFRKTEKEMFRLNFIKTDFYELVESTYNLFLPYSEEKLISVQLHSPVNHYDLAIDREAITKIISNLLSNAIKFAQSKVDIFLETESDQSKTIRLRINNDGKLIPKELSEKIFEPFYQIDFDQPGEKGTGLGLSLARSMAELHHARLFLDTRATQCNSFVLELSKYQEESVSGIINESDGLNQSGQNEFEIFGSRENVRPNILLVEDEIEMGKYIAAELSDGYQVILTRNGDEALKALKKFNVVVVVSDVIMPVINGYELCRQIKSDIEFSHIPVILLTASGHLNARIEGLDSGADAYIEKPFTTELLMAQILNLIKFRSSDSQNFINFPLTHLRSGAISKTDEEFLKQLNSILMDNISETDLSVEIIAEKIGISVSTLYRKVKALTDLNSVEYIRLARLKKAAELLSEGNYRINEISYLVGFSSASYFATSFQKQFGISPSQFARKQKS